MKKASTLSRSSKFLFRIALKYRRLLPKKRCEAFEFLNKKKKLKIEHIYVINLERQPDRLSEMKQELKHILDCSGIELWSLTKRYSAIDATKFLKDPVKNLDIDPNYTLNDQLFVEPQPLALPTSMELDSLIQMSRPEFAVAQSHIAVWKHFVESDHDYILILEDDVWFTPGFTRNLNQAWAEILEKKNMNKDFDILYLSYEEVKNGAPKTFLSTNIFRPVRGLWNLSGYVISRKGAEKLIQLLPCRGPIDLWLNHQFKFLDVLAIKKSIINQRPDINSTNSYSILPSLSKIGAITSESASLFQNRPNEYPVFVFGSKNSGLTSVAMALSMLGYRCCNDLQTLPTSELNALLEGKGNCLFDAYVNIGSLSLEVKAIKERYPLAKFIYTSSCNTKIDRNESLIMNKLNDINITVVPKEANNKWQIICEYLRCAPPNFSFPELSDFGQRQLVYETSKKVKALSYKIPKRDKSPWIIEASESWKGINCIHPDTKQNIGVKQNRITDYFNTINTRNWYAREDTFTDNLALFRSSNIEVNDKLGVALTIKKEHLGVRKYSAASLTSQNDYLYGRFEANIKVSKTPGIVTGFFLHRDSPRQEIDIEISGNKTNRLLVNVFYNPGDDGAKFDYGYRGSATYIDLGFDASDAYHKYTIEWRPQEICWFVDDCLVHRRLMWNPTPIPNLPMSLHVNIWPCRSKELAGRILSRQLPTTTFLKSISLEANQQLKYK